MVAVSTPSRPTMKRANRNTATQARGPSSTLVRSMRWAMSWHVPWPARRMCTTHQATVAAATSAMPPSAAGDSAPTCESTQPSTSESRAATPTPARSGSNRCRRPVLRRYRVAIATTSRASSPSRKQIRSVWNMVFEVFAINL